MTIPSRTLLLATTTLAVCSVGDAFTPLAVPAAVGRQQQHMMPTNPATALHLLPCQASELVAASDSVYQSKEELDDDELLLRETAQAAFASSSSAHHREPVSPTAAARTFVSRIFHIPSAVIHPASEGLHDLKEEEDDDDDDDVCLYPIVGCRIVQDAPDHCRTLPSSMRNPSCRLVKRDEPVYGWFRPIERDESTTANTDENQ